MTSEERRRREEADRKAINHAIIDAIRCGDSPPMREFTRWPSRPKIKKDIKAMNCLYGDTNDDSK